MISSYTCNFFSRKRKWNPEEVENPPPSLTTAPTPKSIELETGSGMSKSKALSTTTTIDPNLANLNVCGLISH